VSEPRRLLIIKPSSLGDIVHALPAVGRLRQHFPSAHLAWVIQPAFAPILAGNPDVDERILFPRDDFRGLVGLRRFWRYLREFPGPWDRVIDFQGLLRSALIGLASQPGQFIGPTDAREGARLFYDHAGPFADPHAVSRNLAVAAAAGAGKGEVRFPLPAGHPPVGFDPSPYVLLHPFSRGAGKSLSEEMVMEFVQRLEPRRVVIVGRRYHNGLRLPGNGEDWINRTRLSELVALMRGAEAVVSVDSGPMHLAAAVNPNVLSLHTWTDPSRVGPWQAEADVWKNGRIATRSMIDDPRPGRWPETADLDQWITWVREKTGH